MERLANKYVRMAISRDEHRNVPIAEAQAMGAMALFGEKYGDEVRVIRYGDSIELCGGTHVANTGNIGMIKIVSESSIAAGIRRIEAITAAEVENSVDKLGETVMAIAAMLNSSPDVVGALKKTLDENADLRKQAEDAFNERVAALTDEVIGRAESINGVKVVSLRGMRMPDVVKNVAFGVRARCESPVAFVGATYDISGKPLLTVMLSDDLVKTGLNASTLVREAAKLIKGGGGGQPGFAQAGGKDKDGIEQAYHLMYDKITANA